MSLLKVSSLLGGDIFDFVSIFLGAGGGVALVAALDCCDAILAVLFRSAVISFHRCSS